MTTSTVRFESGKKIVLLTSWAETMMPRPLFQNKANMQWRPRVATFADIIKSFNYVD